MRVPLGSKHRAPLALGSKAPLFIAIPDGFLLHEWSSLQGEIQAEGGTMLEIRRPTQIPPLA